ncbi:major allergen alt [Fusarium mundagurra]|uniref:Major allergen alt n=1 Tax=Fusarium mundagurra TaxID=1567541 RepID=A0A8H5YMC7_9HYPO|nr:major allergen alt [Fusarium mundagurra]
MRATPFVGFLAATLAGVQGMEETVTVSGLSIHKLGNPVGVKIDKVSFKVTGKDAKNLKCSANNVVFPEPDDILPCGKLAIHSHFGPANTELNSVSWCIMMLETRMPTRNHLLLATKANCHETGPGDETCTQVKPVIFKIDGSVGVTPDM